MKYSHSANERMSVQTTHKQQLLMQTDFFSISMLLLLCIWFYDVCGESNGVYAMRFSIASITRARLQHTHSTAEIQQNGSPIFRNINIYE